VSYRISERRACRVTQLHRGTYRYSSHKNPWTALRMRIYGIPGLQEYALTMKTLGDANARNKGVQPLQCKYDCWYSDRCRCDL